MVLSSMEIIRPSWHYQQSAVIPYQIKDEQLQILLITSRKRKRWIIPKGIIEPDMSPQASAAKEALEEAGVLGKVGSTPLGTYQYEKWNGICRVQVFPMEVQSEMSTWLEGGFRLRQWYTPETAAALIREEEVKQMILQLSSIK